MTTVQPGVSQRYGGRACATPQGSPPKITGDTPLHPDALDTLDTSQISAVQVVEIAENSVQGLLVTALDTLDKIGRGCMICHARASKRRESVQGLIRGPGHTGNCSVGDRR